MPGRQHADCAGLRVKAVPISERGLYFTDETIEVTFQFENLLEKRLKGEVTFFYGFGPSGLDGKTCETVEFDLEPKEKSSYNGLKRLVGFQGNGVIGMFLPVWDEQNAIKSDNDEERTLKLPQTSNQFHTLYTFVTMEREFHERFHARPENIMNETKALTKHVRTLTIVVLILAGLSVVMAVLQALGILPPMKVHVVP